jgi:uncharacterized protein (DUF1015 family)
MAEIVPFRGIRFAASRGRALGLLLAPPYDQISLAQRDELLQRSPHNMVHLILGDDRPGDGAMSNKYTRSGEAFRAWQEEGVLRVDPAPALYPLEQTFWAPDGRQLTRRGFMAALRLHEFREGVIVPHEKTLTAPKADRLANLKTVAANLSPIFGLYRDERAATAAALERACAAEPVAETDSDDGVHQRLWRVEDPELVGALVDLVRGQRVFIADGHHRYETALAYRTWLETLSPGLPEDGGHHWILAFLCPMSDPGLVIYPTHRLLFGLKDVALPDLLARLERWFVIQPIEESLMKATGRAWAVARLSEHAGKSTSFLMVTAEDRRARLLTLRDDADLSVAELPANRTLRDLDVTVLHSLVFQRLLGVSVRSQEAQEHVTYVRDAGEAVNRVLSGEHQIGFLLNPTPMWQVEAVGDAGETMPQKSTLFAPRIPSGLVMRRIDPQHRP